MTNPALQLRLHKQQEFIEKGRDYVLRLRERLGPLTAWVYGSVARGTFKDWSDVDIFVVSDSLPRDPVERMRVLYESHIPGVEPKGLIRMEFENALYKADAQLLRALQHRVVLIDDLILEETLPTDAQ